MAFVIQIENFTPNTVVIPFPGASPLLMVGTQTGEGDRVPLTAEQFKLAAYDIEGHSCGKYGVKRSLRLWARDPRSGEEVTISFAQAQIAIDQKLTSDADAKAEQEAQARATQAKIDARLAEGEKARAEALKAGGMTGEVAHALDGIGALNSNQPAAKVEMAPLPIPDAKLAAMAQVAGPPAGVTQFVPPTHKI